VRVMRVNLQLDYQSKLVKSKVIYQASYINLFMQHVLYTMGRASNFLASKALQFRFKITGDINSGLNNFIISKNHCYASLLTLRTVICLVDEIEAQEPPLGPQKMMNNHRPANYYNLRYFFKQPQDDIIELWKPHCVLLFCGVSI
jgi:hypothetical protein